MVGAERDLLNEDEDIRNTLIWRQLKHRTDGSKTGRTVKFAYDKETGRINPKTMFTPLVTETPGVEVDPILLTTPERLKLPELFRMEDPVVEEEFKEVKELPPMVCETKTMMDYLRR